MSLYKELATVDDIDELEQNLRIEDRREIKALTGGELDPFFCLIESFRTSQECWVVKTKRDNRVVFIYGCNNGLVWAMATPLINKHKIRILKHTKEEVERLLSTYSLLYNIVDSRNLVHLNWLSYAGFEFGESHMINGVKFIEIRKEKCV